MEGRDQDVPFLGRYHFVPVQVGQGLDSRTDSLYGRGAYENRAEGLFPQDRHGYVSLETVHLAAERVSPYLDVYQSQGPWSILGYLSG